MIIIDYANHQITFLTSTKMSHDMIHVTEAMIKVSKSVEISEIVERNASIIGPVSDH